VTGQAGFRGEMAKATRHEHPEHDFSAVTQRGLKAVTVAVTRTHQAAVEPRLPAGMLGGLTADLQQLGVDVRGALVIRSSARAATKSQYEAPARGGLLVTAIWTSVLRRGTGGDVRAAYGVGARGRRREGGRGRSRRGVGRGSGGLLGICARSARENQGIGAQRSDRNDGIGARGRT
jgi:hypothetical protein